MIRHALIMIAAITAASPAKAQFYSPKAKYEREILRFTTAPMEVESVAVSPDGRILAVGTAGWKEKPPKIHLVDLTTGKQIHILTGHEFEVMSLAFSPEGKMLYSGSKDTSIGIWDVEKGKEVKRLDGHQDRVTALATSADGKTLISCTGWSRVGRGPEEFRVWDLQSGKTIRKVPVPPAVRSTTSGAFTVKFSRDLSTALTIVGDPAYGNDLFVTDLAKGESKSLIWKSEKQYSYATACALDGKLAVSAHGDAKIRYWDLGKKALVREVQAPRGKVVGMAFSPDGSRLALDSADGAIRVWDAKTDEEKLALEPVGGKQYIAWGDVQFTPKGNGLITTSERYAFVWDVSEK